MKPHVDKVGDGIGEQSFFDSFEVWNIGFCLDCVDGVQVNDGLASISKIDDRLGKVGGIKGVARDQRNSRLRELDELREVGTAAS